MAVNNGRNLSGYTADSVNNYNNAYQHQRNLGLSDAEAHSIASGILQPSAGTPGTTATTPTTNNTFSNDEVYRMQSEGYRNLGNTAMSDAYGNLANSLGAYKNFANNTLQGYDALLNFVKNNETGLQNVAKGTYNTLINDLEKSRNYVNDMFGPNGKLTKEVDTYYDDLGNYLSTDAGRQAAAIAAQGVHSGASLGAIRAQQNAAYNESFGRYVQAKEQQINAKTQLASNLINYMSALRQEYGDTTNQYIIDLYKRANDMYNSIAQSARADINQYNQLRAQGIGGGGASTTDWTKGLSQYDNGNYMVKENGYIIEVDKDGNVVNYKADPQGISTTLNSEYQLVGPSQFGSVTFGRKADPSVTNKISPIVTTGSGYVKI